MTVLKQINVAVIGTGWCGGIRAETCAAHPLVKDLHVAETRPERLAEIREKTNPVTATADYRDIMWRWTAAYLRGKYSIRNRGNVHG